MGGRNVINRFSTVLTRCFDNNRLDETAGLGEWHAHDQCRLAGRFGKIQVCRPLGIMIVQGPLCAVQYSPEGSSGKEKERRREGIPESILIGMTRFVPSRPKL